MPIDLPDDTIVKKLTSIGTFFLDKVHYRVDGRAASSRSWSSPTATTQITVTDLHGESSSSTPAHRQE